MAANTTIAASFEASRLKYQPDSKYRLKRVAVTTATDVCDHTKADKAKYQIKRARVGDGPGPNERMFAAFLDASHHQHEQEIASLKQAHNHQKQVEVTSLTNEYNLRLSSSDQANQQLQQEVENVRKGAFEEVGRVRELAAAREEEHNLSMSAQNATVQAQTGEIESLKHQISQLQQGSQQLHGQNQCLAGAVASRDTEILRQTELINEASRLVAQAQAECSDYKQKLEKWKKESCQYADEAVKLDEVNLRLRQKNSVLVKKNQKLVEKNAELDEQNTELDKKYTELDDKYDELMRDLVNEVDVNEKATAETIEVLEHIEVLKSNQVELNDSVQVAQEALKAKNREHNTLLEDLDSGVWHAANSLQKSDLKGKESRRLMPSEKRKEEKLKAVRTKSGSAAPKGIQKTKGANKKTLKKAIVDDSEDEDPASLFDRCTGSANDDNSEPFEYASRDGKGLDAIFGLVTPPSSADSSLVE